MPDWARWNPAAAALPWTVGVEEEAAIVDARTLSVVNRIDDVLAAVPADLRSHVTSETHASVVEVKTGVHPRVEPLAAELLGHRRALRRVVTGELGLDVLAAGLHPTAERTDGVVTSDPHHRVVEATMRGLARREPTMALHVHVAVPDIEAGVAALDGLRDDLPLLLALSANSPFWRGRDSGFASMRMPLMSAFPRTGIAPAFGSAAAYVAAVDRLIAAGAIPDERFLWWDARLQPELGTVEVRAMDTQTSMAATAALTALVACRVRHHATTPLPVPTHPEEVAENRFIAARDGMAARLIDRDGDARRPVAALLREVVDECRPQAAALGCAAELDDVEALAAHPGAARQRADAAAGALHGVLAGLVERYAEPGLVAAGATP